MKYRTHRLFGVRGEPSEFVPVRAALGRVNDMYTSIEVCAGAGGQAIGLHRSGFTHLALVEIDPHAAETLRINGTRTGWWGPAAVHETSLVGWHPPAWLPKVDLIAGGVPCPPFSIAGKQLGEHDERDLFPSILDLVERCDPKAVMIENVRGLLGKKFAAYRERIQSQLGHLGYESDWELLEAHDFGVPQLRPRSILVASKPDVWKFFNWPEPALSTPTVGTALLPLMAAGGWEGAQDWAAKANGVAPTLVGGSKKHGGADLGPTRARQAWLNRHNVHAGSLAEHPPPQGFSGPPRLTLPMTAVLQGFPSDWEFFGRKTAAYRQIGNALPPPVAEAVGLRIHAAIAESEQAQKKLT